MLSEDLIKGAKAAAEYCGLPERTIYAMAEAGTIPVIKRGGLLFFRRSELEAAFRSSTAA